MYIKTKPLPDNVKTYHPKEGITAHCIPADGFEKLIVYETSTGSWVHQNFKKEPKKSKKKGKK